MPYITSIERVAKKEGREEGRQEGRREGREEGSEEGILEGIEWILENKFGSSGRKLLPKVRALGSVAALWRFARFLKSAQSLQEVRSRLSE